MDCIEHFKTMQGCFREYPDVYGGELEEDEVDEEIRAQQKEEGAEEGKTRMSFAEGSELPVSATTATDTDSAQAGTGAPVRMSPGDHEDQSEEAKTERAKEAKAQVDRDHAPLSEADELVPKAAFDARTANEGK